MPYMPGIIATYTPLQRISSSQQIGKYAVNRSINGTNRIFFIYFVQDENGVWLVDSM